MATATHAWHCHTVSGDRWLVLKAEYSHRCGATLAQHAADREHDRLEREVRVAEDTDDPFASVIGFH